MAEERWATFSVKDHLDAAALIPEVVLYDRLVIPVPPKDDDDERRRWKDLDWAPELLDQRIKKLDDIAIKVPWNEKRQKLFRSRMKQTTAAKFYPDIELNYTRQVLAEEIEPLSTTRNQLEQDAPISSDIHIPESVRKLWTEWAANNKTFDVVTAYRSKQDFSRDFIFETDKHSNEELSVLLVNEFAIPKNIVDYEKEDLEKLLQRIIDMARDDKDFKEHRKKFYNWQEQIIKMGVSNQDALAQMHNMTKNLNECIENRIEKGIKKDDYQYAYTLFGIELAQSIIFQNQASRYAIPGSLLPVIPDAQVERKTSLMLIKNRPALMFHDVREKW